MGNQEEQIYKKIADLYVDAMGSKLKEEYLALHIQMNTASMDQKVFVGIEKTNKKESRKKVIKFTKVFVPLAASFLLVISALFFLNLNKSFAPAEEAPAAEVAEESEAEFIPLSHPLPSNLSVIDSKLDNGMTIYRLRDIYEDDVVMELIQESEGEFNTEDMMQIEVNGKIVYGRTTDTYNKLIFIDDGIIYTLTCRYDINTLIAISKNIL